MPEHCGISFATPFSLHEGKNMRDRESLFPDMRFFHLLVVLVLLSAIRLQAQQELMLSTLPDLWHSNTLNPAFFPQEKRFAIGLPGLSLDAAHSGDIAYRDIFVKNGDQTEINFGNIIARLDPVNEIFIDQRIETIHAGLRLNKRLAIHAGHANRLTGTMTYPKTLPELIWNGNAPYIGQTVEIAPRATFFDWNEWVAGVTFQLGRVSLGGRFKYLSGAGSLRTDANHQAASIYTSADIYQLTLKSDYAFHSSGLVSAFDTSGLGFNLDIAKVKGQLFSKNTGTAFDLGIQVKLTEKLSLSASALDLGGKIKWKENARYYHSLGNYEYTGVSFPGNDIISGFDSLDFKSKLDTLNDIFQFKKTTDKFSTALPTRFYAGLQWKLNDKWQLALSTLIQHTDQHKNTAFGASVRWQPLRWLSGGFMYSLNDRSKANLGFHGILKLGPAQVYFLSDNLINAFSARQSPAVNLRLGGALMF